MFASRLESCSYHSYPMIYIKKLKKEKKYSCITILTLLNVKTDVILILHKIFKIVSLTTYLYSFS